MPVVSFDYLKEYDRLREENQRLRIENIQMQAALGYGILAEDERHILPTNPFKCGVCDARETLKRISKDTLKLAFPKEE